MLSNFKVVPALAALAFTFALQTSSRAQDSMKHGDSMPQEDNGKVLKTELRTRMG